MIDEVVSYNDIMSQLDNYDHIDYMGLSNLLLAKPVMENNLTSFFPIICTDDSKMDMDTWMAFSVHHRGKIIYEYLVKLRKFNSIFQADLYAINQALKWFTSSFDYVTLYTDSYSSVLILKNFLPGNENIKEIYRNLIDNSYKILSIGWNKSYVGKV